MTTCAVPLRWLKPGTCFLLSGGAMGTIVGVVERIAPGGGYAQVVYIEDSKRREHEFKDRDGVVRSFTDSGLTRTDWSAGTLVRPIVEENEMGEDTALVSEVPASTEDIKAKVAKLKGKASTLAAKAKAGKPVGKPAKAAKPAKVAKAPKAEATNKCKCGCGGLTRGTFCPGHDARYFGWLKKIVAGKMEFKDLNATVRKDLVDIKGVKKALAASGH